MELSLNAIQFCNRRYKIQICFICIYAIFDWAFLFIPYCRFPNGSRLSLKSDFLATGRVQVGNELGFTYHPSI